MAMTSKVSKKEEKYFEAVGRRKTSIARVRLFVMQKGTEITINEKSLEKYLDDYFENNLNYDNNIFALLMLSLWLERFYT